MTILPGSKSFGNSFLAIALVLLSSLGMAVPLARAETNLIQNGDFSNGLTDWTTVKLQTSQGIRGEYPIFEVLTQMPVGTIDCTPSDKEGNPFLSIEVPFGANGYVEQQVTIPSSAANLSFASWGNELGLGEVNAYVIVVDASGTPHPLETFTPPPMLNPGDPNNPNDDTCTGNSTVLKSYDLSAYSGQTVKLRLGATSENCCGTNAFFDDIDVEAGISQPDHFVSDFANEPTVAINPLIPGQIVVASNVINSSSPVANYWVSTHGTSGPFARHSITLPLNFQNYSDPVLSFDSKGTLYYAGIAINATRFVQSLAPTVFVARIQIDNSGNIVAQSVTPVALGSISRIFIPFVHVQVSLTVTLYDKPWMAISPSNDSVYVSFLRTRIRCATLAHHAACIASNAIELSSSSNGKDFSTPVSVSETSVIPFALSSLPNDKEFPSSAGPDTVTFASLIQGSSLSVGRDGSVYVAWFRKSLLGQAEVRLSSSRNSYTPFTVQTITPISGIRFGSVKVRAGSYPTIGVIDSTVSLAYADNSTGHSQIRLTSSSDLVSWSTPKVVSMPDSPSVDYFFPIMTVSGSDLALAFYGLDKNSGDVSVHFTSSQTFGQESLVLNSAPSRLEHAICGYGCAGFFFLGDYIGISTDSNGQSIVSWTDARQGRDQVWVSAVP